MRGYPSKSQLFNRQNVDRKEIQHPCKSAQNAISDSQANTRQVILFSTLGSITYGYCACIIATTLGQPSFIAAMGLDTASNASELMGAINGLFQAGGLIGTLVCSVAADRLGRKKAIFIASCLCVIGGALQAGSAHVGMFIAARCLTGIGIGKYRNAQARRREPGRITFFYRRFGNPGSVVPERNGTSPVSRPSSWSPWYVSGSTLDGFLSLTSQASSFFVAIRWLAGLAWVSSSLTPADLNGAHHWQFSACLLCSSQVVCCSCRNLPDGVSFCHLNLHQGRASKHCLLILTLIVSG